MSVKPPIFCDIGITENCMLRCKMCRIWEAPERPDELSIEDWKDFITSLEEFGSDDIRVHFAGGEPLIKKGILDLISFANKKGFTTVMVTNGFLVDDAMAEKIVRSGLDVLSISLDSLDAGTHDFLRGKEGVHSQAVRAIDYLKRHGAKGISILTVITASNLDSLTELVKLVDDNDSLSSIYFQAISHPIAMPKDEQWYKKDEFSCLWPRDKRYLNSVIDSLIERKNRGSKISNSVRQLEMFKSYFDRPDELNGDTKCDQGDYVVYVHSNGDIFLCGQMAPIGNVKTDNIKELWYSEKAGSRRKEIYDCKKSCLNVINCFEDKDKL